MNTQAQTEDQRANAIALRAERKREMAEVTFTPGGQMFQPKSGTELMAMSNMMAGAGLMVKDIYRNNPGACMGLIAVCAPYGMNPLQVSWKTYQTKTDAPISYESQVIVAMVNASGAVKGSLRYRYDGEGQDRRCIASGTLKGDTDPVEVWSPPLSQIVPKNSPLWKTDPDQQLAYYTGRSWARRYKPEMLLGIYDVDEMANAPAIGPETARDVSPRREPKMKAQPLGLPVDDFVEAEPEDAQEVIDAETGEVTAAPTRALTPDDIDAQDAELARRDGLL